MHILSVSYGNDSIALIQWAHESNLLARGPVHVVYADTGWGSPEWPARVERGEALARSYGFEPHRVARAGGMLDLCRAKRAWPRHGMQFCTEKLKIEQIEALVDVLDPNHACTVVIGVRREESARRATHPELIPDSPKHGNRDAWFPLVRVRERERDELVRRAGFEPLPHRSHECYPCINWAREDLRAVTPERVAELEALEAESATWTKRGNVKTIFRARKHGGALGIREVIRWANSGRGEYRPDQLDLFGGELSSIEPDLSPSCDSGYCGT